MTLTGHLLWLKSCNTGRGFTPECMEYEVRQRLLEVSVLLEPLLSNEGEAITEDI